LYKIEWPYALYGEEVCKILRIDYEILHA
jgi:hypothetical protein